MKKLIIFFLLLTFIFQINADFCFAEEFLPVKSDFSLIDLEGNEDKENNDYLNAVFLSAVVPGAGQVYKGDWFKGIVIFASFFSLLALEIFVVGPILQNLQAEKKTVSGSLEFISLADKIGLVSLWLFSLGDSYRRELPFSKDKEKNNGNQNKLFDSGFRYDLLSLSF